MGYKNVKDLDGGIMAWVKKEYPLYSIFGKIQVVDIKAKDSSPNGTGQVRNVYP
jgi:3-mercaptopyruvate sulfurtransferase SseA